MRVGRGPGDVGEPHGGAERSLGRAGGGGLRVGVRDAWDRLVVGLAWLAADVRRDHLALILPDVREQPDAGDVADRPQPIAGAQVQVDRNSSRIRGDADRLQPDPVHARASSGGHQQMIAAQLPTVAQRQHEVLAVAGGGGRLHPERELDPVRSQRLGQSLAQRRGLAGEHVV